MKNRILWIIVLSLLVVNMAQGEDGELGVSLDLSYWSKWLSKGAYGYGGHGGLFKTERVGQQIMADAVGVPVTVMKMAGEGGPWGMALLAAYMVCRADGESLEHYLSEKVFPGSAGSTLSPSEEGSKGFAAFMDRYKAGLVIERAAIDAMK